MKRFLWFLLAIFPLGLAAADWRYVVFPIDAVGPAPLNALKQDLGNALWIEAEKQLLAVLPADHPLLDDARAQVLAQQPDSPHQLYLVQLNHTQHLSAFDGAELLRAGRIAVIHAAQQPPITADHGHHDGHHHPLTVLPVRKNEIIAFQAANRPRPVAKAPAKDVQALVDQVDVQRWLADVATLSEWNRYAFGAELVEARDWLVAQFDAMPNVSVTTQSFNLNGTALDNVIATITGSEQPDVWYIIGAHYDSISQRPTVSAPGAEDNGSGTAALLELARIFSAAGPKTSLMFIAYSGEEQGLHGSRAHVDQLIADGHRAKLAGVMTMDMIGYTGDEELDVLLETASFASDTLDIYRTAAETYTDLVVVSSLNPFGSDHVPYLDANFKALLVIENDYNQYPSYHRDTDVVANLNAAMGGGVLRMNAAVLAQWAGLADDTGGGFSVAKTLVLPWVSKSDRFESTVVVNNTGGKTTQVRLTARRADGTSTTAERSVAAGGFLAESTATLFPELSRGAGFTVTVEADQITVESRWITNNIADTASGASPSQGTALTPAQPGVTASSDIGDRLLFGYLPVVGGSISAPVVVNLGDRNVDVVFEVYNSAGQLLITDTLTGANLAPRQPLAVLTSDLVPNNAEDVHIIAHSQGNQLGGVVFVFNSLGEPAIGSATALSSATAP